MITEKLYRIKSNSATDYQFYKRHRQHLHRTTTRTTTYRRPSNDRRLKDTKFRQIDNYRTNKQTLLTNSLDSEPLEDQRQVKGIHQQRRSTPVWIIFTFTLFLVIPSSEAA